MKVIIHRPSLLLLMVAIMLDLPVVKVDPRVRARPLEERDSLEVAAEHGAKMGYNGVQ